MWRVEHSDLIPSSAFSSSFLCNRATLVSFFAYYCQSLQHITCYHYTFSRSQQWRDVSVKKTTLIMKTSENWIMFSASSKQVSSLFTRRLFDKVLTLSVKVENIFVFLTSSHLRSHTQKLNFLKTKVFACLTGMVSIRGFSEQELGARHSHGKNAVLSQQSPKVQSFDTKSQYHIT